MIEMMKFRNGLLLSALALWTAGCVDLNYVGQTFPPLPEDQAVALYTPEQLPPEGEYRSIGRATLTAPDGTERETILEKLVESAREHGADAVRIVEFQRIYQGDRYTPGGAGDVFRHRNGRSRHKRRRLRHFSRRYAFPYDGKKR